MRNGFLKNKVMSMLSCRAYRYELAGECFYNEFEEMLKFEESLHGRTSFSQEVIERAKHVWEALGFD